MAQFNGTNVLWRHDSGFVTDWFGTSGGGFTANNALMAYVPNDWAIAATGDINGDHTSDIVWRNGSGTLTDWLGNSSGTFTDNWNHAVSSLATNWHVQPKPSFV